jgi:hypothetical protein
MAFIRRVEHFVCENCGTHNQGDGYTNHCFSCLHSKHVDIEPGDRAAGCRGVMAPVGVETRSSVFLVVHRCLVCQAERRCRTSPRDDLNVLATLSAQQGLPPARRRRRDRGR